MDDLETWKPVGLTPSAARRTMTAQCVGVGAEGDDENAERLDDCEVMQPSGFAARPALTATTEAVAVRRGDELVVLFLIDKGAAAQAVEPGETRLYGVGASNGAAAVRIRASGAVEIASAGATVVKLQDGSQPFVRGTAYADALGTFLDAFKVAMTAVGAFATAASPGPAAVTLNTAIGVVNAAADALKTARTSYLSTKVSGQ